jgi:transposase
VAIRRQQPAADSSLRGPEHRHTPGHHQRRRLHPAAAGATHPDLTDEIRELEQQITTAVTNHTPQLLTRCGIGPDNAAALLIAAGDNPDRLRSEASFAALCGVSPLEASSGKTSRRRLHRGGDRQANAALYRIALCRLRWDTRTRDYLARRITEGKTRREAIRCLKRYIAREIYRIITSPPETQPSAA